jgi:hypothetical protein
MITQALLQAVAEIEDHGGYQVRWDSSDLRHELAPLRWDDEEHQHAPRQVFRN